MGLARKGRWGGKAMAAPAGAMYWMKSTWEVSPSSCSVLSLAARCLWKWCRLGEPVQREAHQPAQGPPSPSPTPTPRPVGTSLGQMNVHCYEGMNCAEVVTVP